MGFASGVSSSILQRATGQPRPPPNSTVEDIVKFYHKEFYYEADLSLEEDMIGNERGSVTLGLSRRFNDAIRRVEHVEYYAACIGRASIEEEQKRSAEPQRAAPHRHFRLRLRDLYRTKPSRVPAMRLSENTTWDSHSLPRQKTLPHGSLQSLSCFGLEGMRERT
ncbi:hypothetical protein GGR57DRAFT_519943 [Xylariaceae sp. FL1272]|nr:hypothetical protein GGR57DRAFT_519943 [Xylariaceae sp. FL1272]